MENENESLPGRVDFSEVCFAAMATVANCYAAMLSMDKDFDLFAQSVVNISKSCIQCNQSLDRYVTQLQENDKAGKVMPFVKH